MQIDQSLIDRAEALIQQAGPLTKGSMDPLFDTIFEARDAIAGKQTFAQFIDPNVTSEDVIRECIKTLEGVIAARTRSASDAD